MQELLGTKGQKLSDMNKMGLPVPYGFIISKTVSGKYYEENHYLDDEIRSQIIEKINELQEITGALKVVLNGAISCDVKNLIDNVIQMYEAGEPDEFPIVVQEEIAQFDEEVIYTRDIETGEKNIEKQVSSVMRSFDIAKVCNLLEKKYKAVQRVSFAYVTQEDATEKMYVLSTEDAKLSYYSEIKTAVDLVNEGIITKNEALKSLDANKFPKTDKILDGSALSKLLDWADDIREVKIRTEIKSAEDVKLARGVGADAVEFYIGLQNLKRGELAKIYDKVEDYGFSFRISDCKRAVVNPDIVAKQVKELIVAAINCAREKDINVRLEFIVPIAGAEKEMKYLEELINSTANSAFEEENFEIPYFISALIETPRAAINTSGIAKYCDLMVFDVQRLTEYSFGLSERTIKGVTEDYKIYGLLEDDPIKSIDREGVGRMIDYAINHALSSKPKMKFGLVGPQTIDEETMRFAVEKNISFISCKIADVARMRIISAQVLL